jgi:hypothetical protein
MQYKVNPAINSIVERENKKEKRKNKMDQGIIEKTIAR